VIRGAWEHVDEVIVVDDGSTDQTTEVARSAGATVFCHERNRGKAMALMTAFEVAANHGIDTLVLIDADGQHNPEEIPRLLEAIQVGTADVVVGSRFLDIRNPTPFYRTIGQRVLNLATHLGSGVRCSDSQCGFRALNRRAFTSIHLQENYLHGLAAESEMQFEIAAKNLRITEVPIYVRYDGKARRSPLKHGFSVLYRVLYITTQRRKRGLVQEQPIPVAGAADVGSGGYAD
jgi:glycosyltransferase involved in cell wall biosynthesis